VPLALRQFAAATLVLLLAFPRPVFSETDAPHPSGAPTDGSDFAIDEPGDDFGFSPPPAALTPPPGAQAIPQNEPPPSQAAPNIPPPSKTVTIPPPRSNPPSARNATPPPSSAKNAGTPPLSAPTAATKKAPPAAPKLTDYLELDPSVKGLEVKNFDLPDKDIRDVVTLISKWTGKNFILDSKVRGKITIIGPSQVTLQEAYQAFLSALDANGLTTVQSGKFIRIIESAEARRAPVKTYSGDYAPKDDQFITRVFQLKYINADEVQREFRDLVTRQGKLFAYEPTNSIIITDTGSNIQRIKELLETLDVKSFETTLHVLKIRNNSAKTIADMLSEIYGESNARGGSGQARSFRRSSLERTRGGGIISKIIPDEQTNSLVVLANKAGFDSLSLLVKKLDVRVTDTGRIHVYYCEYAKAEDLASTLSALSGSGGGAKPSTRRSGSGSTPSNAPRPSGAPGQAAPPIGGGSTGPVTAELGDGVKITSDAATNSLVITANASDYQTLKRVIKKLDIPRLQVFVETAIMEIGITKGHNWGVDYGLLTPGGQFKGGFVTSKPEVLAGILSGSPAAAPSGVTIPGISPTFSLGGNQTASLLGIVNFLASNTNTSVLSTPQIIALDNEKAVFQVQDKIPVVTGSNISSASTAANPVLTDNIERITSGIDISLTPHVNAASRTIRLEIEQNVESATDNGVPQQLQNKQKVVTSRKTNTQVVVKDNDFVVLGGLMSDKVDELVKKVPLLGDIPILGWLFKSKSTSVTKTNLVILLRPRIIGTSAKSAELVDEKLSVRDKFLDENTSGDEHEESINELKAKVREQLERGQASASLSPDFVKNEDDEPEAPQDSNDDDEGPKPKPGEQSEIGKKRAATAPVKQNATPPLDAPLLNPPPADVVPLPPPTESGGE